MTILLTSHPSTVVEQFGSVVDDLHRQRCEGVTGPAELAGDPWDQDRERAGLGVTLVVRQGRRR
jgi:hypothetical protein